MYALYFRTKYTRALKGAQTKTANENENGPRKKGTCCGSSAITACGEDSQPQRGRGANDCVWEVLQSGEQFRIAIKTA